MLQQAADKIRAGDTNYERIETQAQESLKAEGFRPDYFRVVRARDLAEPSRNDKELVILAAAYLGKARLIDNITLTR